MEKWEKCKIRQNQSILDALEIIDNSTLKIALVVDADDKLLGTVTDGDIRRAILKKKPLENMISSIMNRHPQVIAHFEERHVIIAKMREKKLQNLPIVNNQGIVTGLISISDVSYSEWIDNPVVLMVGGLGSRLRPLTEDCPKSLLKIGNKPILETILDNFIECGFRQFYFAVNYKAEMIEDYFGDGSKFDVNISYLHEEKRMGTAGALSLLPESIDKPIIVMNGDLLTKVNFKQLLEFHLENDSMATMGVREYNYQIPYGVVRFEKNQIISLQEKPVQTVFVNAGIYVLHPEMVKTVQKDNYFDMPDLFNRVLQQKKKTTVFPIREYWLDIGQMADFHKAQGDFQEVFL